MTDAASETRVRMPVPSVSPDSEPFWESCLAGAMRLQRCADCRQFWFPPSLFCPNCWSEHFIWEEVEGTGTIVSFVTFQRLYHKAFESLLPYTVVCVELAEGPRMISRLRAEPSQRPIGVGDGVRFVYEQLNEHMALPLVEALGS